MPSFLFLKSSQYLCLFINDLETFINITKSLDNKFIFYSYKNRLSNVMKSTELLTLLNIYNNNYIYIQFILKKIKIKVIILLFLFLITFTHYIK